MRRFFSGRSENSKDNLVFAAKAAFIWFATLLQSCVLSLSAGDLIVKTLGHHFLFISPSLCSCPTISLTSENNFFLLLWYLPIYYDHLHTCALPIKPNQTKPPDHAKSIKEYRNSLVSCPGPIIYYTIYAYSHSKCLFFFVASSSWEVRGDNVTLVSWFNGMA